MISYKPIFISKYLGYMVGGVVLGLIAIATLTSLPFESPNYVTMDYSCGKTVSFAENARVYDLTTNFLLNREKYNKIADIARKQGLAAFWGGVNNVSFFNSPGEDGLLRSTVIPTGAVNSALEEICGAIKKAA